MKLCPAKYITHRMVRPVRALDHIPLETNHHCYNEGKMSLVYIVLGWRDLAMNCYVSHHPLPLVRPRAPEPMA
jgi:hypothetical protein